ncbi:DUF1508 domain-containing protein [Mycobacterium sp. E1747]|uniref:DUF1508 domain-containing protein n=1 Tax=Mycobacterium sp. E1747 TaxID=1834128 RepID=UPI0012EAEE42|nr:DUF1508 domain-containing protein [Mycobacterium sp. E1747]
MPAQPVIYVDLTQAPVNPLAKLAGRAQRWRWRAINAGNGRILAISSESYYNASDCRAAIAQLFGAESNVYLRSSAGTVALRIAAGS